LSGTDIARYTFAVNTNSPHRIRLGTRGSMLAQMQSELIASQLRAVHPGLVVELTIIKTTGDRIQNKPLHEVGGKGLFTRELEQALLAGQIDFAVHSYKDVPVTMPLVDTSALIIAAVPAREDVRDVLITQNGCSSISGLPKHVRVGTGSLRRRCQLLAIRPDLEIIPVRGNIDTRLRKLREGEFDAVILAAAGLKRAQLFDPAIMIPIDATEMVPSPGQGALALQCRADDVFTREILHVLNDPGTSACVNAERELVRLLHADCHSPVGIFAQIVGDQFHLRASVSAHNGTPPLIAAAVQSSLNDAKTLPDNIFQQLQNLGAMNALHPPAANFVDPQTPG
jgi:hydroxymethylbilane synthase